MLHHIISITVCTQNGLLEHERNWWCWRDSPTARSITRDPEQLTGCWCTILFYRRTVLESVWLMLDMLQIFKDFLVSVIFWA